MKNSINWLRISYWTGAIVDAKAVFLLLFPGVFPQLYTLVYGKNLSASSLFTSLSWVFAVLVISWISLLLWADRKPLERKGVLLLTVFPLLTGLLTGRIYNLINGNYTLKSLPFTFFLAVLGLLFTFSYFNNHINTKNQTSG